MKLFLKYYDTYSGVIRLNGRDIRELSEEDIYQQAVVIDREINRRIWLETVEASMLRVLAKVSFAPECRRSTVF